MVSGVVSFLPRARFDDLIAALAADGCRVIGPRVADGAVTYEEIATSSDLPVGIRTTAGPGRVRLEATGTDRAFDYGLPGASWKRFVHLPVVPVSVSSRDGVAARTEAAPSRTERLAFVGVRACEVAALGIQDRVVRAGPIGDADDAARRDAAFTVAVECARAMETCFCTSLGTGPEIEDGADLVLSELDEGYTVRAGSAAGEAVGASLSLAPASTEQIARARSAVAGVRASIGDPVPADGLPERLRAALDHPRWADVAERCLACANCTLVCPTCFCTSVATVSDLDGIESTTERRWDSCFTLGFGRVAGDANFRPKVKDRYRQWLTHKFSTWWDQFGSAGCVGCGRCIAWCPVGIDVREELRAIAPPTAPREPIPWPASPAAGRAPRILPVVEPPRHARARLVATTRETTDTTTLRLETDDRALRAAQPGQFVMVEWPPFAAPPISISRIRTDGLDLTIRAAGAATRALTELPAGAELTVRGPHGRPWPIRSADGRDVVIVAGGIGLAPLRPVLDAVIAERPRYRSVRLYLGARTPRDRLFVTEMAALAGRADLEVAEIVDRAGSDWLGRVGIVTQLFEAARWRGDATTAFVCGPERMMQASATALAGLGVPPESIWVTLERNMACGVGTCGHCQLGPFFVCRDGPVFSISELGRAFTIEGL